MVVSGIIVSVPAVIVVVDVVIEVGGGAGNYT